MYNVAGDYIFKSDFMHVHSKSKLLVESPQPRKVELMCASLKCVFYVWKILVNLLLKASLMYFLSSPFTY